MPVASCQAFVENAWKKDLCSNCFKGREEHGGDAPRQGHKSLTGQDSLTDLQLGTGRYFTLTPQFAVNSRYAKQVHKWNDTVFQSPEISTEGRESQDRSLGDSVETPGTMKDSITADVIERLDSLVLGTPLQSPESGGNEASSGVQGILKSTDRDRSEDKSRRITFPDYEELQEIIGYGGDMYYSSDDEDAKDEPDVREPASTLPDEMTPEERNVISMTKKNTSFNSHAPNLKDPSSSPAPRLGVDKKHTPIVSVRPFVREQKPGKVNMVSPMINGELVNSRGVKDSSASPSRFGSSVRKLVEGEEGSRGEAKTMKQDSLGSDGSTENSSSDSDSITRDSPPPTDISLSEFDMKHKDDLLPNNKDSYTKQSSFLSSQIEEQKAKSSAATERLSFLSSCSAPTQDPPAAALSSQKVKPSNYKDEHVTKLTAAKAKLSLPNKNSSLDPEETKDSLLLAPAEELRARSSAATARLSFLNSTMGDPGPAAATPDPPVTALISKDNAEPLGQETITPQGAKSHPKSKPEKVLDEAKAGADALPRRNDSSRESPKVKLTRKSPYVTGAYTGTAILKGTPKPMITRKPPILKDKPKVPLKPNKLMMRSPSSSPSPSPHDDAPRSDGARRERSSQSPEGRARSSPVPAPRKASFRQTSEYVNLNVAPSGSGMELEQGSTEVEEVLAEPVEVKDIERVPETILISVSGVETKTIESTTPLKPMSEKTEPEVSISLSTSENSPPQVQKNLALKNKEALEAIRKSLSNKLINGGPPARVVESIKALESAGSGSLSTPQPPAQKSNSNSFEEARSSIADALQFNRHDNVAKTSSKRQAPQPPEEEEEEDDEEEVVVVVAAEVTPNEIASEEDKPAETTEEVNETPETKLAPAIRNSSMKSADSSKNKDSKPRSVQFSPETQTVTVPANHPSPKVISYNRWIGHRGPQNPYLESSFTGQPIAMYPPGVITHPGPVGKKTPLPLYAPIPIMDDEPRKWTEKKNKWRSKSTPRSSEIDEMMGSSKTKSSSRMGIFSPSSPQPIKRQSRVEIYESEKKGLQQRKGKFSLKKLFRGSLPEGMEEIANDNKFIDKEHEREILERQKVKVRPEIIHPLDLLNGGVEVVKIIPNQNAGKGYDKQKSNKVVDKQTNRRPMTGGDSRSKSDSDSKDSGHDTSSIHTDTSEGSGGSCPGGDRTADFSLSPLGPVPQVRHKSTIYLQISPIAFPTANESTFCSSVRCLECAAPAEWAINRCEILRIVSGPRVIFW